MSGTRSRNAAVLICCISGSFVGVTLADIGGCIGAGDSVGVEVAGGGVGAGEN